MDYFYKKRAAAQREAACDVMRFRALFLAAIWLREKCDRNRLCRVALSTNVAQKGNSCFREVRVYADNYESEHKDSFY